MSNLNTDEIDVVILCRGRGKRLGSLANDRPKPMILVQNRPFLDLLIEYISSFGYKRFILCTGHKSKYIENYYKNKNDSLEYIFSIEHNFKSTVRVDTPACDSSDLGSRFRTSQLYGA